MLCGSGTKCKVNDLCRNTREKRHKKVERWHVGTVSHFPGNPCEFKEPCPSSDCMLETHLVVPWLGLFLLGPLGLLQHRDLGAVLSQLCSLWQEEAQTMSSHSPRIRLPGRPRLSGHGVIFLNGVAKIKWRRSNATGTQHFN